MYASTSKMKRARRGNEKRWNQFAEPFSQFLGGSVRKTMEWVNRKISRSERKYKITQ